MDATEIATEIRQRENALRVVNHGIKTTTHARRLASLKRDRDRLEQRLAELRAQD